MELLVHTYILAKIESDTVEKLRETITWKIRKIEKIRSTSYFNGY